MAEKNNQRYWITCTRPKVKTMKEKELREHAKCSVCKKLIGESGLPVFHVATVQTYGIKLDSVSRQDGLAAMLGGNAVLAGVMGVDADMAEMVDEVKLTICQTCYIEKDYPLAALVEVAN